ncbi:Obg family GTPase CgtA [Mycolicibacterium insubricum]|uniref:Obg family GTPase CgtA n=1 Tax=Mycolicibacterium insubricum TaxID=444597 RepID=UPI0039089F65
MGYVAAYRAAQPAPVPRRPVIRPVPVNEKAFEVLPDGDGGFLVRGTRPERWIAQTNFDNDEAVGYLGDRLARLGVEDELLRCGAKPGCAVTIGDMTFDWEPTTRPGGTSRRRAAAPTSGWSAPTGWAPPNANRPARTAVRHPIRPHPNPVNRNDRIVAPRGDSHRAQRRGQDRHHRADHPHR